MNDLRRMTTTKPPRYPADAKAPNALLMLLEARAPVEFVSMMASLPWLHRLQRGEGHPVMVFPGMAANDVSTVPLRNFLKSLGYLPRAWGQGFNLGPRPGVLERCSEDVRAMADKHGQPVSLIGWSLGGLYAREMAKELPNHTRCVITLGTPFAGHPRATNAWRIFQMLSGRKAHDPALIARLRTPPPAPTTSIYSRTDGIVAWQCSLNEPGPQVENIEVRASHTGMGMNPLTLYAIADRLVQAKGEWKPFDPSGARRWFFQTRLNPDSATTD